MSTHSTPLQAEPVSFAEMNRCIERLHGIHADIKRADKFGRAVEQWADTVPMDYYEPKPMTFPPITMTAWERAMFFVQDHKFTVGLLTGMWVGAFMAWARFA